MVSKIKKINDDDEFIGLRIDDIAQETPLYSRKKRVIPSGLDTTMLDFKSQCRRLHAMDHFITCLIMIYACKHISTVLWWKLKFMWIDKKT